MNLYFNFYIDSIFLKMHANGKLYVKHLISKMLTINQGENLVRVKTFANPYHPYGLYTVLAVRAFSSVIIFHPLSG
jgi:hypothetical protein